MVGARAKVLAPSEKAVDAVNGSAANGSSAKGSPPKGPMGAATACKAYWLDQSVWQQIAPACRNSSQLQESAAFFPPQVL